ncbi:hypothetical protein SAMN04487843_13111 [Methylobacterium sp. ap11]|nr:hypothetical protein SAMN04487843_13111 [Methylobacterium sp. ap11]
MPNGRIRHERKLARRPTADVQPRKASYLVLTLHRRRGSVVAALNGPMRNSTSTFQLDPRLSTARMDSGPYNGKIVNPSMVSNKMAAARDKGNSTLASRFRFAEDSSGQLAGGWASHLHSAVGVADGEPYLLRIFKKTGTALDDDLRAIVTRGQRRIRRVLSSLHARDVLVEVVEVAEDHLELAILMVEPGSPVSGASHRRRTREGRFLTSASRGIFWRNMLRVAEALTLCHDAGIVHGGVGINSIFSHRDGSADYRLGGVEACVHISDSNLKASEHLLRGSAAISFR